MCPAVAAVIAERSSFHANFAFACLGLHTNIQTHTHILTMPAPPIAADALLWQSILFEFVSS